MSSTAAEPLLDRGKLNDVGVRRKLLTSHAITRLGTQGWLFVAPLVLVRFTPGSILGPACWGMITMLATAFLGPPIGSWADRSNRNRVITIGVVAQFLAVAGSTGVIIYALAKTDEVEWRGQTTGKWAALVAFTLFSIMEKLGAMLSDVSVKREWAPQLFDGTHQPWVNSAMSQIDLTTEVLGPFIAGLLVTLGATGPVQQWLPDYLTATDAGFVATGLLNTLSFWPQLALLRSIYESHSEFLQPVPEKLHPRSGPMPKSGSWGIWWQHPGGLKSLSLSYALLYLTVLSPHGALITGFLMLKGVSAWQLSLLRGAGAMIGILGPIVRPSLGRCLGNRLADGLSVSWLAIWMVLALISFKVAGASVGMTTPLTIFCAAVCFGRPGLYSFELGVLTQEQDLVDKRHRSAIGAVDGALTSLATVVMYGSGMLLNEVQDFGFLVDGSAFFVASGAVTYIVWTLLYKSVRHKHAGDHGHENGHENGHCHVHSHGPSEHEHHEHTLQMEEIIEDGWHEHLTYHPSTCSLL